MQQQTEKYRAFGLIFSSELALPEMLTANGQADICIVIGKVPLSLDQPVVSTPWYQMARNEFLLKVEGIARFYVAGGKTITIEPYPQARWEDIRVFLYSSVFAALLKQLNYMVLHGAAVIINGKGVVLAGQSGVGKTAVTLALHDRGCSVIADEVCAVSSKEGKSVLFPGLPQLSVWQDTLIKENRQLESYRPVRQGLSKYAVPVFDRSCDEEIELSHIVLLESHNNENIEWQSIKGGNKLEALLLASHQQDSATMLADKASYFQLCAAIGKVTDLFRLIYSLRPYQAGKIADFILKELR